MEAEPKDQRRIRQRRLVFVVTAVGALLLLIGLITPRGARPSHPVFGTVYETSAFDLNEARSDPIGIFLRQHLPLRFVQSPGFPARFKDQPRYMDLKGVPLEWSIGGTNTGWLYFWDADTRRNVPVWEFAPCSETNLLSVSTLPAVFFGASDARRAEVFGDTSSTNGIKVAAGQILFARQTDGSNIYILKLKQQDENRLLVDYCVVSPRRGQSDN